MKKKKNQIDFQNLLKGKKIPIIILDERWHELFPDYDKPSSIKENEDKLNSLIKKQGKMINDLKDMKKLKNQLMQGIINNMDVNDTKEGKLKAKKLDKNQKLIRDISEKMKQTEDELIDIPYEIKSINEQLIVESSKVCYERLAYNVKKVQELSEEIDSMRDQLKEKILDKQEMEIKNTTIYSYMHDILGPDLLQQLDDNLSKS